MIELNQVVTLTFLVLFVLGYIMALFTGIVLIALLKHRRDRVPLTYFLLHKEAAKKEFGMLVYPVATLAITEVFTFVQKLLGTFSTSAAADVKITFFIAYIFGVATVVLLLYITYRWFVQFRRFI